MWPGCFIVNIRQGQDPRRFLDGFRNACIAGKMGNSEALKNSGAAAYLTQELRSFAFDLGSRSKSQGKRMPAGIAGADARDRLEAITSRGTTKLAQGFSAFLEAPKAGTTSGKAGDAPALRRKGTLDILAGGK